MNKNKYIVTGGGGYLGKALVNSLLNNGHQVSIIARSAYPELEDLGVRVIRSDLSQWDPKLISEFDSTSGVFHVAAKVDLWGSYSEFYQTNVIGTEHVIEYCRRTGVKNFVHTSSPSVVSCAGDLKGVDESQPYPRRYLAAYPATKAISERLVLRANRDNFRAIILRPHLIFGPGDTSFIPTILRKAGTGKIKIIGSGQNVVDLTYIDDCVQAHRKSMELLEQNQHAGGKAYFISQGEPVKFWDWINQVLELNNLPQIKQKVPVKIASLLASAAELFAQFKGQEPLLTRFLVEELATDHYFNINAARNELGFQPQYSMSEAFRITFSATRSKA